MTDPATVAGIAGKLCDFCDGEGGFEAGGPMCCGGSQWECGASGCTGPIDGRYLEQCPACNGTGRDYLERTSHDPD